MQMMSDMPSRQHPHKKEAWRFWMVFQAILAAFYCRTGRRLSNGKWKSQGF